MAGRGRTPGKTPPRNRTARRRGEWQATPGVGWQHGPIPEPPDGLRTDAAAATWVAWFQSWYAAHWGKENLPQLRLAIQYFDHVQRAIAEPFIEAEGPKGGVIYVRRYCPMTELRQHMDSLGITPKGQQDRRWEKPVEADPSPRTGAGDKAEDPRKAFGHLVAVK